MNLATGVSFLIFHNNNLLSLPPEASYWPSNDHLRPHTSYLCPNNFFTYSLLALKSLCKIVLSLEPDDSKWLDQAKDPILAEWPPKTFIFNNKL